MSSGDRAGNKLQKYHLTNRINKIIKSLYLSMMINFHLFKILVKYKFKKNEKYYQVSMFRHIDYAYNINNFAQKMF